MIHGGNVFPDIDTFCTHLQKRTYDPFVEEKKRRYRLQQELKDKYICIFPSMPNKYMASFKAWKIWFEKLFPYLTDEGIILIGHSL